MIRRVNLLTIAFFACGALALAADPPVYKDSLGDPLPADALARLGTRRLRHGNFVSALAISPTEKIAASGDGDGELVLWDLTTGKELRRANLDKLPRNRQLMGGQLMAATCLAFAPDGKTVAAVYSNRVSLWESATFKQIKSPQAKDPDAPDMGCQAAVFSPDGKWLAVFGNTNLIELLPLNQDNKAEKFEALQGPISAVAFSPDGTFLAAGDNGAIRLWDRATGKQVGKFRRHGGIVNALAFSPDGKLLASGGEDQSIRVWNVASGAEERRFGHPVTRPATQHFLANYNLTNAMVAFSPDSRELISSVRSDRFIRRWDLASGKELGTYEGHQDGSTCVALSRDGKTLLAGAEDSCLRVWDVADGKDLFPGRGHRGRVFNVAFAADGKTLLSAGRDNVIRVWDVAELARVPGAAPKSGDFGYKELSHFGADADRIGLIAFCADGKTLATARHDDEAIQVWNADTGKLARELSRKQFGVQGLSFAARNNLLASIAIQGEEVISLWNAADGKLVRELKQENGQRTGSGSVSLSRDGRRLASLGSGNAITLWDVERGKEIRRISSAEEEGVSWFRVVLAPDASTVAVLGRDNSLSLYATATGKLLHKFETLGIVRDEAMLVPESAAFAPDGRYLAAIGADSTLHLWEIATGKEVRKFETGQGWIGSIAFSPDGRALASGGIDTTIMLWDVTGWRSAAPPLELPRDQLDKLWQLLPAEDAAAAHRAQWGLVAAAKSSLPFLREQLRPAKAIDPKRLAALVADLDNEKFAVRQRATEELEKNLDLVEGDLRKFLEGQPSLEVRQRLEKILEKVTVGPPPAERLRALRVLTVLEQIGTDAARQHIEELTRGAGEAWLTQTARSSLARLSGNP
jgi:WD40 repeat protein